MAKVKAANRRELEMLSVLIGGEKYGREIKFEYERRTQQNLPIGSLYTTLDRMEDKGFVKSREGNPNPEYGGNKRRFYKLTATGIDAYNAARAAMGFQSGGMATDAV